MSLWCLCSKVRVKREDERAELRWKLWLSEKAKREKLMEEMIKVGRSWAQYRMRLEGQSVGLCFDLGFSIGFRPGMI